MGRIVVTMNLTLDGVMQAPGRPDEDRRGGFEHGGWSQPYADLTMAREMGKGMATTEAILFGRRTYQDFHGFWPNQTDDNPFTDVLNKTHKYLVSTTMTEPLPWMNSTLLRDNPLPAIADLRDQPGGNIVVLGSGELVRSLIRHHLVDEYVLLIHPLVLGSGQRLFTDDLPTNPLRLVDSVATDTGVLITTYQPSTA
ncbi:dihydrofolate reductase [Solihabitans fulvus]|uniref:Dihydrofolate reductase n=1 Tax=Solihabitans fulvus TaxID=1892852 RepID=A0A5B2W9S0_9PSEU|nr:dihydrofolate reductase family protein [Solihabitans fulvus]KAA2247296.1 dihydrofolate reductase [Solihabitans fulvus]